MTTSTTTASTLRLVVADTFEQATAASQAVKVTYASSRPDVRIEMSAEQTPSVDTQRGDATAAFAAAPDALKLDQTYTTPIETHNPIELHATVAVFDGTNYTFYETSQSIVNQRHVMAQMLGVSEDQVRVIMKYLGSGFGGKLFPWSHSLLAARCGPQSAAARQAGGEPRDDVPQRRPPYQHATAHAPVGDARGTFHIAPAGLRLSNGSRRKCARRIAARQRAICTARLTCARPRAYARRDIAPSTSMRGPGAVPGLFAIESAVDELAIKLNIDPVRLRLMNEPAIDEGLNVPFSSRHLRSASHSAPRNSAGQQRTTPVGSMRRDGLVVGWGVAAGSWAARRLATEIIVELHGDGTARVSTAAQDIGTGTYTVLAQMVANVTGIALEQDFRGDRRHTLAARTNVRRLDGYRSLVPAAAQAAQARCNSYLVIASQADNSPFNGQPPDDLGFDRGMVYRKGTSPGAGVPFERILAPADIKYGGRKGPVRCERGRSRRQASVDSLVLRAISSRSRGSLKPHGCESAAW